MDMSLPKSATGKRAKATYKRGDIVIWPSGSQHGGGAWCYCYSNKPQSEPFELLKNLGAKDCVLEGPDMSKRVEVQFDAILDLVGNSVIVDSLRMLRRGGKACLAGWLAPIKDFNPLLQMASGVYLTFFGSFVFGTPGFPLSDVPLQKIAKQIQNGELKVKPSGVFKFDEIREAHRVMEANEAAGKLVVVIED